MVGKEEAKAEVQVVDEVSGWLRVYSDGTVDRTWFGPPEVEFLATPHHPTREDALRNDGIVLFDLTLPPPLDVPLRVYLPAQSGQEENKNQKLPLLLHFQGGGFCISRATWYMYYQFYSRVATACNAVVVSVTTRLAPEHRLPAAIDDGYAALLWLRALAQSDHSASEADLPRLRDIVDFSRVFLIGDSSGGNIVHHVASRAGAEGAFWAPLKVAGAIPIHPGFVRSQRSQSELEGKQDPFLTLDMLDKFLALALPLGSTKDHPFTCPMFGAAAAMRGLKMPPMMVAVADNDLIRSTNVEYCEAMHKAGKDVEIFRNHGVGHSFYLNKIAVDLDPTVGKATRELIDGIKGFVQRH